MTKKFNKAELLWTGVSAKTRRKRSGRVLFLKVRGANIDECGLRSAYAAKVSAEKDFKANSNAETKKAFVKATEEHDEIRQICCKKLKRALNKMLVEEDLDVCPFNSDEVKDYIKTGLKSRNRSRVVSIRSPGRKRAKSSFVNASQSRAASSHRSPQRMLSTRSAGSSPHTPKSIRSIVRPSQASVGLSVGLSGGQNMAIGVSTTTTNTLQPITNQSQTAAPVVFTVAQEVIVKNDDGSTSDGVVVIASNDRCFVMLANGDKKLILNGKLVAKLRNPRGDNVCFLNSVIQCLAACPQFVDFLLANKYNEKNELIRALANLFERPSSRERQLELVSCVNALPGSDGPAVCEDICKVFTDFVEAMSDEGRSLFTTKLLPLLRCSNIRLELRTLFVDYITRQTDVECRCGNCVATVMQQTHDLMELAKYVFIGLQREALADAPTDGQISDEVEVNEYMDLPSEILPCMLELVAVAVHIGSTQTVSIDMASRGPKFLCYCQVCVLNPSREAVSVRTIERHMAAENNEDYESPSEESSTLSPPPSHPSSRSGIQAGAPSPATSQRSRSRSASSSSESSYGGRLTPPSVASDSSSEDEGDGFNPPPGRLDQPAWQEGSALSLKQVLVSLATIYASEHLTQNTMTLILKLLKSCVPDSALPETFAQFKALLDPLLLTIHGPTDVCVNDCEAFTGDKADLERCDRCGEARRDVDGKPVKQIRNFSLIEYIEKVHEIPEIRKLLSSHSVENRQATNDTKFSDIHHTRLWQNLYKPDGFFEGNKKALSLSLAFDGTNVFKGTQYCLWPIIIHLQNLPPYLRTKLGFSLVYGFIPGPRKPKSLNAVMDLLRPELEALQRGDVHVKIGDRSVQIKARLILCKGDYEGISLLLRGTGANSEYGCLRCEIQSFRSRTLDKQIYGQSRRFLDVNAPERDANGGVFCGVGEIADAGREDRQPPVLRTGASIRQAMTEAQRQSVRGFKAVSRITDLARFDSFLCCPNDIIHAVVANTRRLLMCLRKEHPCDGPKTRKLDEKLDRHQAYWAIDAEDGSPVVIPAAPWNLSLAEQKLADSRRKHVFFPANMDYNKHLCMFESFSQDLNSSDIYQSIRYKILTYCLRGMLPVEQNACVTRFVSLLISLFKPCSLADMEQFRAEIAILMRDFEVHFPLSLQTLHMHHNLHLSEGIELFGSFHSVSNFATDRLLRNIKLSLHKSHHVEISLMNSLNIAMIGTLNKESELLPASLTSTFKSSAGMADFETNLLNNPNVDQTLPVDTANRVPRYHRYFEIAKRIRDKDISRVPKLFGKSRDVCLSAEEITMLADFFESNFPAVDRSSLSAGEVIAKTFSQMWLLDRDEYRTFIFHTAAHEMRLQSRSSYVMCEFAETGSRSRRNAVPGKPGYFLWLGRIRGLWQYTHADREVYEMALISWYEPPRRDASSDLWYCNAAAPPSSLTLLPCETLMGCQVIVAMDNDNLYALEYV